jgi:hypothetical protein
MRHRGRHSRCLCGPGEGFGAKTPPSLSSIQWLGALSRLRCFLGPRGLRDDGERGNAVSRVFDYAGGNEARKRRDRARATTRETRASRTGKGDVVLTLTSSRRWSAAAVSRERERGMTGGAAQAFHASRDFARRAVGWAHKSRFRNLAGAKKTSKGARDVRKNRARRWLGMNEWIGTSLTAPAFITQRASRAFRGRFRRRCRARFLPPPSRLRRVGPRVSRDGHEGRAAPRASTRRPLPTSITIVVS